MCVYNIFYTFTVGIEPNKKYVKQYNHLVTHSVHPARHVCVVMQFEKILIDTEAYILQKHSENSIEM